MKFRQLAEITYRQARRIVILVVGVTVIVIGVALMVLPGPAMVVIPAGLAILALEFAWARRWLQMLRESGEHYSKTLWQALRERFAGKTSNQQTRARQEVGVDREESPTANEQHSQAAEQNPSEHEG